MTMYLFRLITLFGGLALFLFGMDVMGKALERSAGGKLQTILAKMSSNVFKGFLLGLGVTAVIQSSSATTVMVVGFVNSGIMTLKQAVGVIMGSNIGTTVTAWILSLSGLEGDSFLIQLFKPSTLAPLLGTAGIVLYMFLGSEKHKNIGTIMLGFLALMTGMDIMGDSMAFLEEEPWFAQLMVSFSNPIIGILFGAVLTAIIQSSSASVGILQGLCGTGVVTFGSAIPIILGQNIGTCITAVMGAIGANRNARRTAAVHLLFNLVGVTIFVIVFYGLGLFVDWKFLTDTCSAWNIAVIHTCFNVAATAVLMPMNGLLVKLSGKNLSQEDNRLLNTLLYTVADIERIADHAVSVANASREMSEKQIRFSDQARTELEILERAVADALERTVEAYTAFDFSQAMKIEPQEQVIDLLVREVKSRHIRRLRDGKCSVEYGFVLDDLLTAFERTADHCSNVAVEMLQVAEGKLEAHEYLNALKAGELSESAAFVERFAKYKAKYAFPEER